MVLFLCHLMGLVFFLVLIGSAEVYVMRKRKAVVGAPYRYFLYRLGRFLWLLSDLHHVPAKTIWLSAQDKLVQFASPFINYWFYWDMASAALVYGGVFLGVTSGWLRLPRKPQWRPRRSRSCTLRSRSTSWGQVSLTPVWPLCSVFLYLQLYLRHVCLACSGAQLPPLWSCCSRFGCWWWRQFGRISARSRRFSGHYRLRSPGGNRLPRRCATGGSA